MFIPKIGAPRGQTIPMLYLADNPIFKENDATNIGNTNGNNTQAKTTTEDKRNQLKQTTEENKENNGNELYVANKGNGKSKQGRVGIVETQGIFSEDVDIYNRRI